MPEALDLARLRRNFLAEQDSAVLYEALAACTSDARQRDVYHQLAASEREHARYWEERLRSAGQAVPSARISPRTRLLAHLARWFGSGFVVPAVTLRELSDHESYARQRDAMEAGLAAGEHAHAELLRGVTGLTVGTNLRAAILGANDGLTSNFSLLMGVAGGGAKTATLLLAGIAGLIGGALSMALGEWLSVTNSRELAENLADREVRELHRARTNGDRSASREAWNAAKYSFGLFALGAAVPLIPFALLGAPLAIGGSIAGSIAALYALGLATSLFNGRSPAFSALRQTAIGAAAALATYGAGRLFEIVIR